MLFCNEFSICTIYTGDSMSKIPHPRLVAGVQGSSWKLISFRILKAQETVLEGKIGGEIHM